MSVAVKVSGITLNRNLKLVASCLARSVSQMVTPTPSSQMDEIVKKFRLPKAYEGSRPSVW